MKLIPIYEVENNIDLLLALDHEVEPHQVIIHAPPPTRNEELRYVRWEASRKIEEWYFIEVDTEIVGFIFLSQRNEIGIRLFRRSQSKGYGPQAIRLLMEKHGNRRYVAHINPANEASRKMLERSNFKLVQHTYVIDQT